jgi:putative endonuclease
MAYTYILLCGDGTYYTGATMDWERRLNEHQQGKGARYTRARLPVSIVYIEEWSSLSEAMQRESKIKKLTRPQKEQLIASSNNVQPQILHKDA